MPRHLPLAFVFLLIAGCSAPEEVAEPEARVARATISAEASTRQPQAPTVRQPQARAEVATHGLSRAIVVFVQFRDDRSTSTCAEGLNEWPPGQPLPRLADYILAQEPTPPFPDSSLTEFFYRQSNGNYVIYGDVFGYTTRDDETAYRFREGESLDRAKLTREIVEHLAATIDFREYDADGDGFVDNLFVFTRNFNRLILIQNRFVSGISSLGGRVEDYDDLLDGVRLDPNRSGTYNRYAVGDVMRENILLLAHEFGHDLFGANRYFGGHLNPIVGNRMPHEPPEGEDHDFADRMTGYSLMQGAGTATERIRSSHLSAAERSYINADRDDAPNWIDCIEPVHGETYSLRDTYQFGDCLRIAFEEGETLTELFVQHSDGQDVFNSRRFFRSSIEQACPGCRLVETGIPVEGLMIELSRRNTELPFRAVRDLVPADNRLTRVRGCNLAIDIGPSLMETFQNDFWRPDNRSQLTPWTRPNVFGYTFGKDVPTHYFDSGRHVLDNFRYTSSQGTNRPSLAFDYLQDPLSMETFTISEDSWMDEASDGIEFLGEVRLTSGATLTIDSGVTVLFTGGLIVEDGSRLLLEDGARAVTP